MYCVKCGTRLNNGINFCPVCGTPVNKVNSSPHNVTSFNRTSITCKSCNGVMNYIQEKSLLVCPFCGRQELLTENPDISITRVHAYKEIELEKYRAFRMFEQSKIEFEQSIAEHELLTALFDKLDEIEREQPKRIRAFHRDEDMEEFKRQKIKRKAALIKTYPLPQSFNGLVEFLQIADSNINVSVSKHQSAIYDALVSNVYPDKPVSDAWVEKYISIYRTLQSRFGNDPRMAGIRSSFEAKMQRLRRMN